MVKMTQEWWLDFSLDLAEIVKKKKKKKLMVLELSAKTTFQEKLLWVKDQMFLSNQFTGLLDPKYLWKESIII